MRSGTLSTPRRGSSRPRRLDGVLVDEFTYRATSRVIRYEQAESVTAKGKSEAVPVWVAVEPRSVVPEQARVDGLPLVGRERTEAVVAADALERSRDEPSTQFVSVIGEPGIGKTRLVEELCAYVEEMPELITWRRGRSLSYGEGVAFWALGEMVKAQAGILESDSARVAEAKLAEAVAAVVVDEQDRGWVERHLRPPGRPGGAGRRCRGWSGGGVRGVAAVLRGTGRGRARRCWCSRTSIGPMTHCWTSSTCWPTVPARSRC